MRPVEEILAPDAIHHHFAGQGDGLGVYAKETHIPAGVTLFQHAHNYAHLSILQSGSASVDVGGIANVYSDGAVIVVPKGVQHKVVAITDVVWFCIHPTNETDPAKVDEAIMRQGLY